MKKICILLLMVFGNSFVNAQKRTVPSTYDSLNVFLRTQSSNDTLYTWALRAFTFKVIAEKADNVRADSLLKQLKNISEKLNYGRGIFFYHSLTGFLHSQKSEYQDELRNYQQCLEIANKYKLNNYLREMALLNIANSYNNVGDKDKCMAFALKAVELQEKYNFPIKFLDPSAYGLVSAVLRSYDRPQEALKYAEKALAVSVRKQDFANMGIQENRIGGIYEDLKQYKNALPHYLKGLEYSKNANYLLLQTDLLAAVGQIYTKLKEPQKSETFLLENERLSRQLESPEALHNACEILGRFYVEQGSFQKAKKYLTEAYQLNKEIGAIDIKMNTIDGLVDFYEKTHDYPKAFSLLKEYNALNDSATKINSEALSRDLLAKYETAKKESEIKLLNEEKKAANFQRNALLVGGLLLILIAGLIFWSIANRNKLKYFSEQQKLRNRIAADLHDEIGSTLSSISILSEIVAFQQQKGQPKPEIMQLVSDDARVVINKMDDIIWTINPENDEFYNLETRLKSFAIPLLESKDIDFKFDFSRELEMVKIDMGKRRDMYLILKEAINNLLKYSQCKTALISGKIEDKMIVLSVKDDGVGFDTNADTLRNGQRNMQKRAEKIGGSLIVNSQVGGGTEVILKTIYLSD